MRKSERISPPPIKILLGIAIGIFLGALDQTVISSASPTIATSLHHLSSQAWLITIYLLPSLITTPIYGRLSDSRGRRPLFLTALIIFLFGSLLAIFAMNFAFLLLSRFIQGLGAGGLFSLAFAVIADILPPRERSRYVLLFVAIFGSASLLGPVIGGVIATQPQILGISGWRWIFIINIPIALLALALALAFLHVDQKLKSEKFDWLGSLFFALFLTSLLLHGAQFKVISLLALGLFLFQEFRKGSAALIPLKYFTNKLFALTVLASAVANAGMFVALSTIPLLMQVVHGATPFKAGATLLVMGVGNLLGAGIASRSISKKERYRWIVISGSLSYCLGFFILSLKIEIAPLIVAMLFLGLGSGFITQFTSVTAPYALGEHHRGAGSAINTFLRQFGGILGAGLSLAALFAHWNIRDGFIPAKISLVQLHFSAASRQDFQEAIQPIFIITFMVFLATTALMEFIPRDHQRDISQPNTAKPSVQA